MQFFSLWEKIERIGLMEENTVLDPSDEEDGWILACRSKPKSRFIEISFDE